MQTFAAVLALAGAVLAQTGTGILPRPTGTVVVSSTVYVCPTPTVFVCEGQSYTATKPSQTFTVYCTACQITPPAAPTVPATPKPPTATFTGAADRLQVGGAVMAAAIGLMAL